MVDEASLLEGTGKLQPDLVVAELFLAAGDLSGFVRKIRGCAPVAKVLLLTAYDHPNIIRFAAAAGADGLVVKRLIASDLLTAVDALLAGASYRRQDRGIGNRRPASVNPL